MKSAFYFFPTLFSVAMAAQGEEFPFYQQRGYTVEEVADASRREVLDPLGSIREFQRMQGITESCKTIYHVAEPAGQSLGYGSICKTSQGNLKGFFCWDSEGRHFGYSKKHDGANPDWMGNSILQGCGGVLVPNPDHRREINDYEMIATPDGWILPTVGWGEKRPVLTMLHSDIERLGFDISPGCEDIRLISLGLEENSHYGASCTIDDADNKALICFDNLAGHFGLFTRHQDTSKWIEHTIYRFCWNDPLDKGTPALL
jgi:hypothetical protein